MEYNYNVEVKRSIQQFNPVISLYEDHAFYSVVVNSFVIINKKTPTGINR